MSEARQLTASRGGSAPLEVLLARWMRERQSGSLRFHDEDGEEHTLALVDGVKIGVRSPAEAAKSGPDRRHEQAMSAAERVFRKSAGAVEISTEEGTPAPAGDEALLDAFEVLHRGVRAKFAGAPPSGVVLADKAPFVLHREADLEAFPLRRGEEKIVRFLTNLSRSFADLRDKRFLPEDELVTFLYFLLLTHNAFRLGQETRDLVPLGELTAEERLLREPQGAEATALSPFASRVGLALLAFSLVPLGLELTREPDLPARIARTMQANPDLVRQLREGALTMEELLSLVPGRSIEGAFLPFGSAAHWLFAAASFGAYLAILGAVFERGRAKAKELPVVALFTATAGVVMLVGAQWLGEQLRGVNLLPTGFVSAIAAIGIHAFKLIAMSYRAAADPRNGFLLSFFGFTLGVGLCEEVVKILPVTDHFRKKGTLDVHGAMVWGMASGVGLGVAEGVLHGREYHGIEGAWTYVVRFVSCVALHAVWTGSAAVLVHGRRKEIHPRTGAIDRLTTLMKVIATPMVLHGLYDTLLKRGQSAAALGVAIASFGYLAFRLSRSGAADSAPPLRPPNPMG